MSLRHPHVLLAAVRGVSFLEYSILRVLQQVGVGKVLVGRVVCSWGT